MRGRAGFAVAGLLLPLLASACSTSSGGGGNYAGKTIVIGVVLSEQGPGDIYAPSQRRGIDLAREVVNKDGVLGASLDIQVVEDGSDRDTGAKKFQELIEQKKVYGLVGPTLTNTATAAHPVANTAKVPVIAISNTGPGTVGTCAYPCSYVFRDSLGEAAAVPNNVKYAFTSSHPKKAVLMYENDDKSSFDGAVVFDQALKDNAIENLGPKNSNGPAGIQFSKAETRLDTLAAKARDLKPDVIALSTLGDIGGRLVAELRTAGYAGLLLGGNGFNSPAVAKAAGASGKDLQVASAYWLGSDNAANRKFVDAYREKYKEDPDQLAAQAYTAVLLFAEACRSAGLKFTDVAADRDQLRGALERVNVETPLGPFSFNGSHDVFQKVWINALDGKGGFANVSSAFAG